MLELIRSELFGKRAAGVLVNGRISPIATLAAVNAGRAFGRLDALDGP